jgi:phosphate ABC transporter phosphate-binding protein
MRWGKAIAACLVAAAGAAVAPAAGAAESYQRISGEGSSWAAGAIDAMRVNVKQFGITVDYNPSGSTAGRKNFLNGTVDFAASDIPFQFQPEDGSAPDNPAPGSYAYMPVTAGGTSFMYNLKVNGQRVTNLRLSGENLTRIFTGTITAWDDPALAADNPGLTLPKRKIVPVVRSDGSGSSAQFTRWMISEHGGLWQDYCKRSGRAPKCGQTSFYPTVPGMIAQGGDLGVAGYVSQSLAEGAIGYVNYSYSLGVRFPVAKVLNAAGYYNEPTPDNVAVSLLKAGINQDPSSPDYLTQQLEGVYRDTDPRNYPLSSYSYLILPTAVRGQFNEAKGKTMGAFSYYAMCQAQEQSASLGYSPMPINLVTASFDQIKKIPGVVRQDIDVTKCRNPTFSPDGTNLLAKNAPQPQDCDRRGPSQCATGTGGAKGTKTAVKPVAGAPAGPAGGAAASAGGGPGSVAAGAGNTATGEAAGTATAPAVCDPETGACTDPAPLASEVTGAGEDQAGAAGPGEALAEASLRASSGWSGSHSVMALVVLLTLALLLAPGVASRLLSRGSEPSQRSQRSQRSEP